MKIDYEDLFVKKVLDAIKKANNNYQMTLFKFSDETKQEIIKELVKNECHLYFDGGYDNAEYKKCIISPFELDEPNFKIQCFQIKYPSKFMQLNHRMVLGTIMSLGISRESIGDIVFIDSLCYFACTTEMCQYLKQEFKFISNKSIELLEVNRDVIKKEDKYENKLCFLSSMRLDVVLSGMYGLSRNASHEMIVSGSVKVNHVETSNPSLVLKEGDLLSIRGKGRLKILSIGLTTKSGRIKVELGRLI